MDGLAEYMIERNLPFRVMWEAVIDSHQLAWVVAPWRDETHELGYGLLLCQCDLSNDTSLHVDYFGLGPQPECYFKQTARTLRHSELRHRLRGTLSQQEITEPGKLQEIIRTLYAMWQRGEFLGEQEYDVDAVLLCYILGLSEFEQFDSEDYERLTRHIVAYKLTIGRDEPNNSSFWSEDNIKYSTVPMRQ